MASDNPWPLQSSRPRQISLDQYPLWGGRSVKGFECDLVNSTGGSNSITSIGFIYVIDLDNTLVSGRGGSLLDGAIFPYRLCRIYNGTECLCRRACLPDWVEYELADRAMDDTVSSSNGFVQTATTQPQGADD